MKFMATLSILITTYHQAYLKRGGGEYELQSVADGLRQLGCIVDIYGPYSRPLEAYDVVLHFSVSPGGLSLLNEIKNRGKPIVLWPNLWGTDLDEAARISALAHVELAQFVAFKSLAEQCQFLSQIPTPSEKAVLCRWIADSSYLKPAPLDLFPSLYNVEDYALWFGIVEPIKNQLAAIRVLKEKGIPLVLVGQFRDEAYMQACYALGRDNVCFIEALPQKSEIIRSAMQCARFYVELSIEPPGLSAIEAGLSGCRLLLSKSDWSRELFANHAVLVDPLCDDEIARGVDEVQALPPSSNNLQNHLMRHCFPEAIMPLANLLQRAAR